MTQGKPVYTHPTDEEAIVMRFNDAYWSAQPYSTIAQRLAAAAAQALAEIEAEHPHKKGTPHELHTKAT